jgi:NAD(P)-dependent dehydrogenase (short-subunit alcohol dehydrogenase family)
VSLPEPTKLFDLGARVALVTGGGTGIGLAIARALAGAGAAVVIAGRRKEMLAGACDGLKVEGARAAFVQADVSDRASLKGVAARAAEPFGPIGIVVHAAGMNRRQTAETVDDAAWDEQVETMLAAPFFLTRALIQPMIQAGWGRVILIASLQSARAMPDSIPYGAAKGGTVQLVRAMAERWSRHGIAVNAIAPGFFPTALTAPVFADAARTEDLAARTAIGRLGALDDLHGAAIFLASRASDYVTGQTLDVDGGFTAK